MDNKLGHIRDSKARNMLLGGNRILTSGSVSAGQQDLRDLARIDAALKRLEKGQFGLCTSCGGTMEIEELLHDPAIAQCQGCR